MSNKLPKPKKQKPEPAQPFMVVTYDFALKIRKAYSEYSMKKNGNV